MATTVRTLTAGHAEIIDNGILIGYVQRQDSYLGNGWHAAPVSTLRKGTGNYVSRLVRHGDTRAEAVQKFRTAFYS